MTYKSALDPVVLHTVASDQVVHLLLKFSRIITVVDLDRYKDGLRGMSIEPMIDSPENVLQLSIWIQNHRALKRREYAQLTSTS